MNFYVRLIIGLSFFYVFEASGFDETYLDETTGLEWQVSVKDPDVAWEDTEMVWSKAMEFCHQKSEDGWRLPNVNELISLMDLSTIENEALTGIIPQLDGPVMQHNFFYPIFWSSTRVGGIESNKVYAVGYGNPNRSATSGLVTNQLIFEGTTKEARDFAFFHDTIYTLGLTRCVRNGWKKEAEQ